MTVTEEQALLEAVKTRLTQLSQKVVVGLLAISGFPQDFTAEQAQAICGVSRETLERIVHAFPLSKEDKKGQECYGLLPAVRTVLHRQVSELERGQFRERHAEHFYEFLEREKSIPSYVIEGHLSAAAGWFFEQPPSRRGLIFFEYYRSLIDNFSASTVNLKELPGYLEQAVKQLTPENAALAAETLATLALDREDFSTAIHWLRLIQERLQPANQHAWLKILTAAHHANDDVYFDELASVLLDKCPFTYQLERSVELYFRVDVRIQIAENRMARRRFEEAMEHNEASFALRHELGYATENLPVLLGQRAGILQGLGRSEDAEQCWDRALLGYEVQGNRGGVAECYQELGKLAAQTGRGGLGASLVGQAISIFKEVGNPGAVAAAQGTLGDILWKRGEREGARVLYEKGLAFWQERQHPRWTAIFEARLQTLEKSSGKI